MGLTVAITGSRRASELAHLVKTLGGKPYLAPTIGIDTSKDVLLKTREFVNSLAQEDIDYCVFMTGPGIYSLISSAEQQGLKEKLISSLNRTVVIARSEKPMSALGKYNVKTHIIPKDNTTQGIVDLFSKMNLRGKNLMILWHGSYSPLLYDRLKSEGAKVLEFSTYHYTLDMTEDGAEIMRQMHFNYMPPEREKVMLLIKDLCDGKIDVITFTSPPSVHDLFKVAEAEGIASNLKNCINERTVVAVIGPSTKAAAAENGIKVDVMPAVYKMGPLIKSIAEHVTGKGLK